MSSSADVIRDAVRERYAGAARQAQSQERASCSCDSGPNISQAQLYEISQIDGLPDKAVLASLGCGNPTLLAQLNPGETVLDLGSGGGIDVLLSAKRVGPTGKAFGLDMTDEMLELARSNAKQAGATNVEFLKGEIESIPLPDASVDVIISNCVINLSADKDAVLREAYRVLKPGGRFAVADIVVQGGPLPEPIRKIMALWAGCISGALSEDEYRAKLASAGFTGIEMETLTTYSVDDVPEEVSCCVPAGLSLPEGTNVISAFVRATRDKEAVTATKSQAVKITGKSTAINARPASAACCGGSSPSTVLQGKAVSSGCCGSESPASGDRGASACCTPGSSATLPVVPAVESRRLDIELMYLDLTVCDRCQGTDASLEEAISEASRVLQATGVEVTLRKCHIQSEEQARQMSFVSSPTIRINGRDLQLDVRESLCGCCSDLASDDVDCRVWVYQGAEYDVPPKAMIMDAILREVYGGPRSTAEVPPRAGDVPDNLKRFFAARRGKEVEGSREVTSSRKESGGCCGSSGPSDCCG